MKPFILRLKLGGALALVCLLSFSLVGCGGGSNNPGITFATEQRLSLQAGPYLNQMPTIIISGIPPACENFIVPIAVRSASGIVASDIKVGRITVGDGKTVFWSGFSSPSETRVVEKIVSADDALNWFSEPPNPPTTYRETVLLSIARDCPNAQLTNGKNVVVTVELFRGKDTATVSAVAKIYAAS